MWCKSFFYQPPPPPPHIGQSQNIPRAKQNILQYVSWTNADREYINVTNCSEARVFFIAQLAPTHFFLMEVHRLVNFSNVFNACTANFLVACGASGRNTNKKELFKSMIENDKFTAKQRWTLLLLSTSTIVQYTLYMDRCG